jgi:DNA-binding FrmR family transcriptional regulator
VAETDREITEAAEIIN